jgi:4-aminobutyrate aminotransferase
VEHSGTRPDIVTVAKGIASGLPLSGIIARENLFRHLTPGIHGGTYGGNVVACAAANATLDVIEDEGLVLNAAARGAQLIEGLRALKGRHPTLGDVRGLGCMVALEFVRPGPGDRRMPDSNMAQAVLAAALERRLIMLSAGSWGQVVRIIPPLVTTAAEVEQAIRIVDEAMTAAAA